MLYINSNLLLIHLRKTGGTSLEKALGKSDNHLFGNAKDFESNSTLLKGRVKRHFVTDKHTPLRSYRKNLDTDYFKQLTIVCTNRNPWRRMMSMYFWSIQKLTNSREKIPFDKKDFLELIEKQPPLEFYACTHRWQSNPVLGSFINPLSWSPVSLYLRQEHLKEDYESLCQKLKMAPVELPSLNLSSYVDWQANYDEECRERVRHLFRHEIDHFSYTLS